jgi:hypothetical protein
MEELVSSLPDRGADSLLAAGIVEFGPHLLHELKVRATANDRYVEAFESAWELFGAWLAGKPLRGTSDEGRLRALAGLELWSEGGEAGALFAVFIAQNMLELPFDDPYRDTTLARRLLTDAYSRALRARDDIEILRCTRTLLEIVDFHEAEDLIAEGQRVLDRWAQRGDRSDVDERDWRLAVSMYLESEAERREPEDRASLLQVALVIFEPVVIRPQPDAAQAVENLSHWSHLLMRADFLDLAAVAFHGVELVAKPGSGLAWHARFERGLLAVDVHDWSSGRECLESLEESLLVNYAAFVCFEARDDELGKSRLFEPGNRSAAQREVSEGLSALGVCEAAAGEWEHAFRHVETTKALDFRQRALFAGLVATDLDGVEPSWTAGHEDWAHGVPPAGTDGMTARWTTVLARELRAPDTATVAAALEPDEGLVSLGISQATWGVVVSAAAKPAGFFLEDVSPLTWLNLLGSDRTGGITGSLLRPIDMDALGTTLLELLPEVDELVGVHAAKLLRSQGIEAVTLIPHGWLNLFPFWALPSFSDLVLSTAASAGVFASSPRLVAASGEGVFAIDPTGDLPASYGEYAAMSRHGFDQVVPTHVLRGAEVTSARLRAGARRATVMHFTGHAYGNAFDADAGFVVASPDGTGPELLRATSLSEDNDEALDCGLAILSACESGRGSIRIDSVGDYTGLPAALQLAGASSVVATLWSVPDHVALIFVDLFYEQLAREAVADVPRLVREASRALEKMTGTEASERLTAIRDLLDFPRARLRLEAYAGQLKQRMAEKPFARPDAWAAFYHTGARFLELPRAIGAA